VGVSKCGYVCKRPYRPLLLYEEQDDGEEEEAKVQPTAS